MAFYQEPRHYQKTILSDLQGAWIVLREAVAMECETKDFSQLLFHIDEAMSWESVRNFERMRDTVVLIQSLAQQASVSEAIMASIEDVRETLHEVLDEIQSGKPL
jgi:hypothetical protein